MLRLATTFTSVLSSVAGGSLLHPFVRGHAGSTVNGHALGSGLLPIAGACIVLALLAGLGRLWLLGWRPSIPRPSVRSTTAFVLSFLIVSGMVLGGVGPGGGAVGTASAASVAGFQDCDPADSLVGALINGVLNPNQPGECRFNPEDADSGQTRTDIFAGAETSAAQKDVKLTSVENRLTDARAMALTEAKLAAIEAMNNNASKANATDAAETAVEDYYSTIQANLISEAESLTHYSDYASDVETNETGDSGLDQTWVTTKGNGRPPETTWERQIWLLNGSTRNISQPELSNGVQYTWFPNNGTNHDTSDTIIFQSADNQTVEYLKNSRFVSKFQKIHLQNDQVRNNVGGMVDGIYSGYSAGELNASDVLSPTELYSRAATDYNSTGYSGFAAAQLAATGYSGNISMSHVVNLSSEGAISANLSTTEVSGTIFYTGSESVTLEKGRTYDPTSHDGSFVLAYQTENQSGIADLTGNFSIAEQIDTSSGESVNSTSTETYVYNTTDTSDLQQTLTKLEELRQEYQQMNSGGDSIGWDWGSQNPAVVVAVVLAAILVLKD